MSGSARHRLSFTTTLPPEECRRRLAARCASWREAFFSGFTRQIDPARPLFGFVTTRGFRLFLRITYRNSFQTRAAGRFRSESGGTRVDVRFGASTWVKLFTGVWFAAVGIAALGLLVARVIDRAAPGALDGPWILVPFAMLALGIGIVWFCRWLARDEEGRLRQLITHELDAREGAPVWSPIE